MKLDVLITFCLLCTATNHGDDSLQANNTTNPQVYDHSTKRSGNSGNGVCPNCIGCELVWKQEFTPEDLENFKFPAAKAGSGNTTSEADAKMQATFKNFANLVVGISHLTPPPIGTKIRAAHGIFTSILAITSVGKSSPWEQIERKVEAKIEGYFTYNHFKHLEPFWLHTEWVTKTCHTKLTRKDLMEIMKMKSAMFPQNNDHISFTTQWVSTTNAWLMFVVAFYLELTRQGKLPQCALIEEMVELRGDVVTALKALQMKRWRSIRGHDYSNDGRYTRMQYKDEITGNLFPSSLSIDIQQTESRIFESIDADTFKMIDPLRKRFNEILNVISNAMEDCSETIEPIRSDASHVVAYPKACYGDSKGLGYDYPCLLPCEFYGWHSYWCPSNKALSIGRHIGHERASYGVVKVNVNWERCDPAVNSLSMWKNCFGGLDNSGRAVFFKKPWGNPQKKAKKVKMQLKNKRETSLHGSTEKQ